MSLTVDLFQYEASNIIPANESEMETFCRTKTVKRYGTRVTNNGGGRHEKY